MNRIREVLDQKGIKQVWLADQLGKSYNRVNSTSTEGERCPNRISSLQIKAMNINYGYVWSDNETTFITKPNAKR